MVKSTLYSVKHLQILEFLFYWFYMEYPENMKSLIIP